MTNPKLQTAVIISDVHIPNHSRESLDVALQITKKLNPDVFIINGDLLDCYSISNFDKDPNRLTSLQMEINIAGSVLNSFASATPKATRYILEGNHELRLSRTINNLDGKQKELPRLEAFQQAINWPSLLKLNQRHYHWIPTNRQPTKGLVPGLVVKHGDVVRMHAGYSANAEFQKYNRNGISGHTHRLALFSKTILGESQFWIEGGCLCSLTPEYLTFPNWQQGFVVITYDVKGTLYPELVSITDGQAIFRGQLFESRV